MIRVGGLWENKDKNGNTYLSGNMGGVRIIVFRNSEKRGDKSPDWSLHFDENKQQAPRDNRGARDDDEESF